MSAPQYVPRAKAEVVRSYVSSPRRPDSWTATRPGDLHRPGQPSGPNLGNQGPDQGYALHLARHFQGRLTLRGGEHEQDAIAGSVGVALKRASIFGRAPVIHDLRLALELFGFLGEPPDDLVELRRSLFEEVANPYHYVEQRRIVDMVPESTLRMTPDAVAERVVAGDWRLLLADPEPAAGSIRDA